MSVFSIVERLTIIFFFRLMRAAEFNGHEVVCAATRRVTGFALNPHLALINHSCDANYGRVWGGSGRVGEEGSAVVKAFATRPIK